MVILKSSAEIDTMRAAGRIVFGALDELKKHVRPGISTWELDRIAEEFIRGQGAIPSFKGLYGFPATICASINEEIVHGIPSKKRVLTDGSVFTADTDAEQVSIDPRPRSDAQAVLLRGEPSRRRRWERLQHEAAAVDHTKA